MVFARFRRSLTSATLPPTPHKRTRGVFCIPKIDIANSLWWFVVPGRISSISLNERKFGIKRGMNVKCFSPSFHLISQRATQTRQCAARGDDHLSWHCRDDCLDVHESICRAYQKSFAISLLVLWSDKGLT